MSFRSRILASLMLGTTILGGSLQAQDNWDCNEMSFCNPCDNDGRFFGSLGYVYFQASMDNLEFVGFSDTDLVITTPPKVVLTDFDVKNLDFDWNSGVRASLGYQNCNCPWIFSLVGNYLPAETSKRVSFAPEISSAKLKYLIPLWNPELAGNLVGSAKEKWELNFGTLDLLAAYRIYSCEYLSITPQFGLRAVWIDQDLHVDYENLGFILQNGFLSQDRATTKFRSKYEAIGFKAGLDFEAPIFCNINIVGNVAGSLVYGHSKLKTHIQAFNLEDLSDTVGALGPITINSKDNEYRLTANFESELGLLYKTCWCARDISLGCTYFFDIWFDQNRFKDFVFTSTPVAHTVANNNFPELVKREGNLQLQGVVIRADVSF